MQINTLYLPLKEVSGKLSQDTRLDFKVADHLARYGRLPKWTPKGYYRTIVRSDAELSECIEKLLASVQYKLTNLSKKNPVLSRELSSKEIPHWSTTAGEWNKVKCQLLHAIRFLCRAKAGRSRSNIEVQFYHINTHWLALNQIAYGKETTYKQQENVARVGNFIPMNERFYGRRRKA